MEPNQKYTFQVSQIAAALMDFIDDDAELKDLFYASRGNLDGMVGMWGACAAVAMSAQKHLAPLWDSEIREFIEDVGELGAYMVCWQENTGDLIETVEDGEAIVLHFLNHQDGFKSLTQEILENYTSDEDEVLERKEQLRMVAHRILDDIGYTPALPPSPWDKIPGHPWEEWKEEVSSNNTRLGYQEWVWHRIEAGKFSEATTPKRGHFEVEIRETSKSRLDWRTTIPAYASINPKEAFRNGMTAFHCSDMIKYREGATELLECAYDVLVTAPDGEVYLFSEEDDNNEPFIPEDHQAK